MAELKRGEKIQLFVGMAVFTVGMLTTFFATDIAKLLSN